MPTTAQRYAAVLWLLLGLFAFRVLAQLAQRVSPVPWLPPFDAWQGSGLPYPALVGAQVVILVLMWRTTWRLATGRVAPRQRTGTWYLTAGATYFAMMVLRLIVGAAHLSSSRWFAAVLPTLFHLVLASAVLIVGAFHRRSGPPSSPALPHCSRPSPRERDGRTPPRGPALACAPEQSRQGKAPAFERSNVSVSDERAAGPGDQQRHLASVAQVQEDFHVGTGAGSRFIRASPPSVASVRGRG